MGRGWREQDVVDAVLCREELRGSDNPMGFDVNRCHPVKSGWPMIHSFHGIAHTKYEVKWFKDVGCKEVLKTSRGEHSPDRDKSVAQEGSTGI